ncbi:MAG: hypothetical protein ACREL5_05755 [Gemmatimonadales bacterium]
MQVVLLAAVAGCAPPDLSPANTSIGLYVAADVRPTALSLSDSTAVLDIRILTENPSDQTIIVVTGGPPYTENAEPEAGSGISQSYRIARPGNLWDAGPSADWWGSPADTFPPRHGVYAENKGSLKSWRDGGWTTDTGMYTVRSFYNGHEGASTTFRLVP